jgi:putative oxidoreductase
MRLEGEQTMTAAGNREGQIDGTRLIVPGLAGFYQNVAPYSYAAIRFCAGAILIYHGYGKLFAGGVTGLADHVIRVIGLPAPMAWAYFIGILECFGGAALAVGFLTRPIALMLTIEFMVITYWHSGNGYVFGSPHGGYEYPLLLTFVYAAIFFRGAGRGSIDRMIGKEF